LKKFICLTVSVILLLVGCTQTPTNSQSESITSSLAELSQSSQNESSEPSSSAASSDIKSNGDYEYVIADNGVIVKKYIGSATDVVIPDTIDGLPVKVIGESAFEENKAIEYVKLPDSVVSIEKSAFEDCYALESIEFGKNIETVGEHAFDSCWNLEKVILNDKLIEVSNCAFAGCENLETLTLPDSVEIIGDAAFDSTGIKEFVFPPKVTVISESVFYESKLEKVTLPEHVKVIEGGAFGLTYLTEIFIPDSVTTFDDGFYECFRSLIIFYDNNPLVPQHAKECNLLCFKRSEYNPVLTVDLVGGKPLSDDKNLGISQDDYNRIGRLSMSELELRIKKGYYTDNSFYTIAFDEYGVDNGYIRFMEGDDLSQEAIKQKLLKTSTMLYQCGITEYDPKTVKTGEVGCYDKLVAAAINFRSPEEMEFDVLDGCDVRFVDDEVLYLEVYCLFDFIPDASLVTGYSEQQHGIWYYPKELPTLTTEVLSFNGNLDDGNYILKVKFTDNAGTACEKTFSYSLVSYQDVSGNNYRVMLKGIQ